MFEIMEYTWEEIYKDWSRLEYERPILKSEIQVSKIKINNWKRSNEYFYGLDWVENERFQEKTEYVSNQTIMFLLSNDCLNKGTLATLKYLVEAENDEIRAAIWIYAFIRDIKEWYIENWRGKNWGIIEGLERSTYLFLREQGIEWHHAMKKLVPEIEFSNYFLNALEIDDKRILVELAAMEADYVLTHFRVAEYDSRD